MNTIMEIIKWYAIILISFSCIRAVHKSGKDGVNLWIVICACLLEIPIIIYLILS